MNYRKGLLAALLAPIISLGSGALSNVHASGFALFTQGASALGQGNAVTAHSQSPSTIFFNPALINRLEGTQFEIGTTVIVSSHEFSDGNPADSTSNTSTFFPSTFYVTHKFNNSLSAGLGVFTPFGLGTRWNDDWTGRYTATKSDLQTFDFNPVLSYQVTPALSVAAGVDVIYLNATLENKIFTGGPDVGQKFKGDGTGVGFNVGVAYDLCKSVTLGAAYRSEVKITASGNGTFSPEVAAFGLSNSGGKADITLPQQVTAALAYTPIDALTLEAGMRWEGWSSFDKLTIALDSGLSSTSPRAWNDTWGFNLGARYRINDTVALLGGYIYGNTGVPDTTFDPSIPDAATHIFCAGTDLNFQPFKVGLSYAYQMYVDRTKHNDIGANPLANSLGLETRANGKDLRLAQRLPGRLGLRLPGNRPLPAGVPGLPSHRPPPDRGQERTRRRDPGQPVRPADDPRLRFAHVGDVRHARLDRALLHRLPGGARRRPRGGARLGRDRSGAGDRGWRTLHRAHRIALRPAGEDPDHLHRHGRQRLLLLWFRLADQLPPGLFSGVWPGLRVPGLRRVAGLLHRSHRTGESRLPRGRHGDAVPDRLFTGHGLADSIRLGTGSHPQHAALGRVFGGLGDSVRDGGVGRGCGAGLHVSAPAPAREQKDGRRQEVAS